MSHFINKTKNYFSPEPRLSLSYMIKKDMSVKASYSLMSQYIHLLSNTGIGLPTDLWLPSTDRTGPERSQQVALGAAKDFIDKNFAVTLEGYYKTTKHKSSFNIISYFFFLTVIITFLGSCTKTVDNIKIPEVPPKLVVYSYISPADTLVRVYVSMSVPVFNSSNNYQDGMKVISIEMNSKI